MTTYTTKKKHPRICIISLTFNRPDYIKRSFDSLKKRTSMKYDHYVFDDNSNDETRKFLRSRTKDFKSLVLRDTNVNVFNNFVSALREVPDDYDYYIKLDSDIEILSDNILREMLEVIVFKDVGCVVPRVEGVSSPWKAAKTDVQFYNGHAIRFIEYSPSGGFMLFVRDIVNFNIDTREDYGIDTRLSQYIGERGLKTVFVEDLSVYHIDNMFGQRKKYPRYFSSRRRWKNYDYQSNAYLQLSKKLGTIYIERQKLDRFYEYAKGDYFTFSKIVVQYTKEPSKVEKKVFGDYSYDGQQKVTVKVPKYRITSPSNFPRDTNIEHGTSILVNQVPEWAKNNYRVVVERVTIEESIDSIEIAVKKQEPVKKKNEFECSRCSRTFSSQRGFAIHNTRSHKKKSKFTKS